MSKLDSHIDALRERLTSHLADWGTEMSSLLKELSDAREELAASREGRDDRDDELKVLEDRVNGQSDLIETLKAEAEDVALLRGEVRAKDLQIEQLTSEVESKQELVRALRRDAGAVDRLKAEAKTRDAELGEVKRDLESAEARGTRAEQEAATLRDEVKALKETADDQTSGDLAELEAMRAELDARKTLIKSLRADVERVASLEAQLEEKRGIVGTLEASINRHSETIANLKRGADVWKQKYQTLKSTSATTTSTELPAFSDTDLAALEQLEQVTDIETEHTIAIDMRQPLREARRKANEAQHKR